MDSPTFGFQLGLAREEPWQKIRRRKENMLKLFIPFGSLSEMLLWAISVAQTNVTAPFHKVSSISLQDEGHHSLPFPLSHGRYSTAINPKLL